MSELACPPPLLPRAEAIRCCGRYPTPGPVAGNVVLGTSMQPLPFGKTTLAGTEAGRGATYNWNLK